MTSRGRVLVPLALLLAIIAASARSQAPAGVGLWEPAFNHVSNGLPGWPNTFNALHVGLIPVGPRRGQVVMLDLNGGQGPPGIWAQRWAVGDFSVPYATATFENAVLPMPNNMGDLFCAGHAWTADGRFFVAGGTTQYIGVGAPYIGGRLMYIYDPFQTGNAAWTRIPDMLGDRWYPTVTLLPDDRVMISGGAIVNGSTTQNNHEIWDPATLANSPGPSGGFFPPPTYGGHGSYPRMHVLATGAVVRAGPTQYTARLAPNGTWTNMGLSASYRTFGSSLLVPWATNKLMILGGYASNGTPLSTVQFCQADAGPGSWAWTNGPSMGFARVHQNATILPDGSVFVVGGRSSPSSQNPPTYVLYPEIWKNGQWTIQPPHTSVRDYHSTSLLLPDGRVFTGGSNVRTKDYQVFRPPYMAREAQRPVIIKVQEKWGYSGVNDPSETIEFEADSGLPAVDRAVLIRPGSVTHHTDYDQRFVPLAVIDSDKHHLVVKPPSDSAAAPRGWYMLFILTGDDLPSAAAWVNLQ